MALNDKFQLTNYGSEVQKAIDDALITIPQDLALKAYRDEVLVKNQTTPYIPTANYHPATKLYVDNTGNAINIRLDDEIARAKAAEDTLNVKQVLLWDEPTTSYKYINLVNLDNSVHALVDENALDARIAELNTGFFIFYQLDALTGDIVEGRLGTGINPYIVVKQESDLPATGPVDGDLAITLNDSLTVNVYKYTTTWALLNTPEINNGWLFASASDEHGYYWFANTWNLIDMHVDMSQYYTKIEMDDYLTQYVRNDVLGNMPSLTTTHKTTVVGAINEVDALAKTKDTLPTIQAYSVLVNNTASTGKPNASLVYSSINTTGLTIAQRTTTGQIKVANAVANDEATTLSQVNSLIANQDLSAYQAKIPAGTANNIVAYSGTAGTLNTLTRVATINATIGNRTDTNIPTEKAVGTYVDNYKPIIVTQGNTGTSVTTSQLTFWIEQ